MEQVTGENLLTELSCDMAGGLYGQPTQGEPVLAKDCTWADDCAMPLSDPQPDVLVAKSSRLASIVLDYCMRHGMKPNLKPKKTAYIMGPPRERCTTSPQTPLWCGGKGLEAARP